MEGFCQQWLCLGRFLRNQRETLLPLAPSPLDRRCFQFLNGLADLLLTHPESSVTRPPPLPLMTNCREDPSFQQSIQSVSSPEDRLVPQVISRDFILYLTLEKCVPAQRDGLGQHGVSPSPSKVPQEGACRSGRWFPLHPIPKDDRSCTIPSRC